MAREDVFKGTSNFEIKKIFERTNVFGFEVCGEDAIEKINLGEIIPNNENIIDIDQDDGDGGGADQVE